MAKAADIDAWDHTASTIATIVAIVVKNVRVEDYHPYRRNFVGGAAVPATAENLKALKGLFPQVWTPDS